MPLAEIDAALPDAGTILDLGCGSGNVAGYLARRPSRRVIGIDLDAARLESARRRYPAADFVEADVLSIDYADVDGAVLSDVLHHIPTALHDPVLAHVRDMLAPTGTLVVKEIDTGERLRSALSRVWDRLLYPRDDVYFQRADALKARLEAAGFEVRIRRVSRTFPGSSTLFICTPRA